MKTYHNLNTFSNGGVHYEDIFPFIFYDIQPITSFIYLCFSKKPVLDEETGLVLDTKSLIDNIG